MDFDDVKDGLAFFFCNAPETTVFSFDNIKKFFDINNALEFSDTLESLLSDMVSDGDIFVEKSDSGESVYSYDDSFISRINDRNEELSLRWIIPKDENYDYVEESNEVVDD